MKTRVADGRADARAVCLVFRLFVETGKRDRSLRLQTFRQLIAVRAAVRGVHEIIIIPWVSGALTTGHLEMASVMKEKPIPNKNSNF
ncbi:hypothetical protein EVAR_10629_1 [Eumeta japonica]|uniref:Uncharacterized protein n=1 Tax=Eumeta variegata TaxID=151549 RepID=A0A4C1U2S9_EUMVA|nr:hypothetical protein EVAR_10629_1 [Eumeta japonica]